MSTSSIVARPIATVDAVHPSEQQIFTLEHSRSGLDTFARAAAPFASVARVVVDGFDGRGGAMRAIAVRVIMVVMIRMPRVIVPALCATTWFVMGRERERRALARANGTGEDEDSREYFEITAKGATRAMEGCATTFERLASVAEWRSRTVSAATMYAAWTLCGMSLFVSAETMMCWIALYATRPSRLKIVPDPVTACWSRLPSREKEASKIQ